MIICFNIVNRKSLSTFFSSKLLINYLKVLFIFCLICFGMSLWQSISFSWTLTLHSCIFFLILPFLWLRMLQLKHTAVGSSLLWVRLVTVKVLRWFMELSLGSTGLHLFFRSVPASPLPSLFQFQPTRTYCGAHRHIFMNTLFSLHTKQTAFILESRTPKWVY